MFGSPWASSPVVVRLQVPAARSAGVVGLAQAVAQRQLAPVGRVRILLELVGAERASSSVRICETHSERSAAPAECQLARPCSSSRPSVFSHRRWPTSAFWASNSAMFDIPVAAAALRTVPLSVATTVSLAQSASAFQTPQPPMVWRVKPLCE